MLNILLAADSWMTRFSDSFIEHFLEEWRIGDIGEEINREIMQFQYYFSLRYVRILLTDAIMVSWFALLIMFIICRWGIRGADLNPTKRQTIMELVYGLVISTSMGFGMNEKEAKTVAPMIISVALMITSCNMISYFELPPPAKNIAFPFALGIFIIIYVTAISIKFVGVKGFWNSLVQPMSFMLPFKILDMIIKPISLSLRLFGNVFGAFVFMKFLYIIFPVFLTTALGLWFDLADGLLQAVVFSYLTMSYIGEIVEVGHELMEESEEESRDVSVAEAV